MHVIIRDKLASGLPGTAVLDDLSDRAPAVRFRHAALYGPYDAAFEFPGTVEEGYKWADERLGNPVEIYSPDGQWCWEGLIWSVSFGAGIRRRTRSLEGYANRIVIDYQLTDFTTDPPTVYGPVSSGFSDSAGQAVYGVIEQFISGGQMEGADANARAEAELAKRTRLLWLPESGGGEGIVVECMGWWRTLTYRARAVASTARPDIRTIIQQELSSVVYGADNAPMISDAVDALDVTGITAPIAHDTMTPADVITECLAIAGGGWTFGIDQGRVPYLRASNRLSTTPTYFEDEYGIITDAGGAEVASWALRPDNVLRQVDFAPTSGLTTAAIDAIENVYIVETTFDSTASPMHGYEMAVAGMFGEVSAL